MERYLVCNHDESDEHFIICNSKDQLNELLVELNVQVEEEYCVEHDFDEDDFDEDNPCSEWAGVSVYSIREIIKAIKEDEYLNAEEKNRYEKLLCNTKEFDAEDELLDIIDEVGEIYNY